MVCVYDLYVYFIIYYVLVYCVILDLYVYFYKD